MLSPVRVCKFMRVLFMLVSVRAHVCSYAFCLGVRVSVQIVAFRLSGDGVSPEPACASCTCVMVYIMRGEAL